MRKRWRSWPRWKWAIPTLVLAIYLSGAQPTVLMNAEEIGCYGETEQNAFNGTIGCIHNERVDPSCFSSTCVTMRAWSPPGVINAEHRQVALYLTNLKWRLFDVDVAERGHWLGFGTGVLLR